MSKTLTRKDYNRAVAKAARAAGIKNPGGNSALWAALTADRSVAPEKAVKAVVARLVAGEPAKPKKAKKAAPQKAAQKAPSVKPAKKAPKKARVQKTAPAAAPVKAPVQKRAPGVPSVERIQRAVEAGFNKPLTQNDRLPFGLAWIEVKCDGRSRLALRLKEVGFEQVHGTAQLWTRTGAQGVDANVEQATNVVENLRTLGIDAEVDYRLD